MTNQLELRHLQYFVCLAETLHYGKAAETLLISQSALSQQIQRLEFLLKTPLFKRHNRKVALTPAGQLLKQEAQLILNQVQVSLDRWQLAKEGAMGVIRIGFVGSAMQHFLPPKIKSFVANYPDVKCSLDDMSNAQQIKKLSQNQLDVGFIRSNKVPPGLQCQSVLKENLCLVLPSNHWLNKDNFTGMQQLSNAPFILFPNQQSQLFYQQIMALCAHHGFAPKVSHRSIHGPTIFKLVENGLGVSIVPKSLVNLHYKGIRFIELDKEDYQTELFAVWNPGTVNQVVSHFLSLFNIAVR